MLDALVLLGGFAALIAGGESLVRGASNLASRLRVRPIIVGMTVVAFGTSTPELVVNLVGAARGGGEIGFGNIVGSNIANVGLLLAVTALVYPIAIHRSVVTREIPMMLLASVAVVVLGLNSLTENGSDRFTRGDGVMLLLLFCVFLYYTLMDAVRQRDGDADASKDETPHGASPRAPFARVAILIVAGLLMLVVGGTLTVRGGAGLARTLGAPETLIGLTIIAVGTSLPEFATIISAARRGHSDIAVGSIVGSNIFNLLFIWGLTVTIAPSELPTGGRVDLLVMTAFAVALLPMALTQRKVSRIEGALLALAYAAYLAWLAL